MKESEPKIRSCLLIFVDLEKAFDQVLREVIRFALWWKGVPEYLIVEVMSLYKGRKTAVLVDKELSRLFSVKVSVHQGSSLSRFLFIMVMDVLIEDVRYGLLMEFLYADDLVLCRESLDEVMDKYR